MWLAAALVTALCFGTNFTIYKWGAAHGMPNTAIQFCFHLTAFLLVLAAGLATGSLRPPSAATLVGLGMGCLNVSGNLLTTRAFAVGPASLVSPLVAGNTMIPVLASALLFREAVTPVQWAGILLILSAVAVVQYRPGGSGRAGAGGWLGFVIAAMLCYGSVGILMKTATALGFRSPDLLVALYAGGALTALPLMRRAWILPRAAGLGAVAGLLSAVGYACYFYAVDTGIASIVFPVVSLNCLVVMAGGYFLFAERLRPHQWVGLAGALIGLVLTRL